MGEYPTLVAHIQTHEKTAIEFQGKVINELHILSGVTGLPSLFLWHVIYYSNIITPCLFSTYREKDLQMQPRMQ